MKYEFEYWNYVCKPTETVEEAEKANAPFGWEAISYHPSDTMEIYFRRLIITDDIRRLVKEN